jgi:hypothetical protein
LIFEGVSDNTNSSNNNNSTSDNNITRKDFLKAMFWGGTGLALGGMGFFKIGNNNKQVAFATHQGIGRGGKGGSTTIPVSESARKARGIELHDISAHRTYGIPWPDHKTNGEENDYRKNGHPTYIANYSKGLPHNKLGEVDREAYETLLRAVKNPSFEQWENVRLGTFEEPHFRLFNPLAGLTFPLQGPDPGGLFTRPPPRIDSAEGAFDEVEVYWMSLARDVYFGDFDNNKTIERAADDLSSYRGIFGYRNGKVTPDTIFRAPFPGVSKGPYISQFGMLGTKVPALHYEPKDGWIIFGWANKIDQRILTVKPGKNYLTNFKEFLRVQNGHDPRSGDFCGIDFDSTTRFIRSPRDLTNWVHYDDLPTQEFTMAAVILNHQLPPCQHVSANPAATLFGGTAPFDPENPYKDSATQEAFFNFGPFHPLALVAEVVLYAMRATWFQKWYVHRRARPEEFGGLVHIHKTDQAEYPIHPDIIDSNVFDEPEFKRQDSFLLSQAFPEGCPTHPSYTAGHATVAGAQATILKALYDETYVLPYTVIASKDGTELKRYTGPYKDELTVGGELNKLASNIAFGRNWAGVHWKSDALESLLLGEKVAIELLEQRKNTFPEKFDAVFTKFNGEKIEIAL